MPLLKRQIEVPAHLKPAGTSGTRLLEIERSKAAFSSNDLQLFLFGQEYLDRQKRLIDVFENEPAFDKNATHYLGRQDKFKAALAKEKRFVQLSEELGWDAKDQDMAEFLLDCPGPFGLHKTMYRETLRSQGSDEQHRLFLDPANEFKQIGCYMQTELGHGSNVQGLETTITYIPETKEFEVHSPSLTACKWWIGGLGRTASHGILMGQLYTNGKHYGPHPIVMPLRDPETREPLPGRTIFDIGPKLGYNTTDNGGALFDHVRVPHVNFLSRHASVDPETGAYNKPPSAKIAYGTMTFIRAGIVQLARLVMARSATVAIRYCAVRRQFVDRDAPQMDDGKQSENQVLNYQMVQVRLFPVLVSAFACHFTGREMLRMYEENQKAMESGDFSLLADTHASSSSLKTLTTLMAAEAIETCRRACGGHGFSMASGLGSQYQDYLPQITWEGDSYMLTQQHGRYAFKTFRQLYLDRNAKVSDSNLTAAYIKRYLDDPNATAAINFSGDFHDPRMFIHAFGHRAAYLLANAIKKRDIERKTWNSLLVDIYRVTIAHGQFLLVYNFAQAIMNDKNLDKQPALKHVLADCFELFACHTMNVEAAEFLSSGYLSPKQHELLRNHTNELLYTIRPQAVALVDGWGLPDYLLNSALGRSDGDVYPALVDFALREPVNGLTLNVDPHDPELIVKDTSAQAIENALKSKL